MAFTERKIHAAPYCVLAADITRLAGDPRIDAGDHFRCHAYSDALLQGVLHFMRDLALYRLARCKPLLFVLSTRGKVFANVANRTPMTLT